MGHTSTEMLFKFKIQKYSQYIPNLTHRDGSISLETFYGHGHFLDTIDTLGGCIPKNTVDLSLAKKESKDGTPERIRTSDLRFRKPSLYPTELRAQ